MKKYFPLFILGFTLLFANAQSYTVGVQSLTWTDSSRSNRSVPVEFHYPGTNNAFANDSFGFVVFGHGFDIPINGYYNFADSLAAHGYIVALTSNEGGLSPSHPNLAQDLIYIYNMMISQSKINSASILYHHVKSRGAIAGHSMGGGCAVLSCQYSDTATCYWTLSEATTTPSSITAAASMYKPYLSFAGSSDCIAPPSTNQIPTYDSSHSVCKTLVEITNATHCQFALNNSTCVLGEDLTGCGTSSLSLSAQTDSTLSFLYPFLDYYLNGNCSAWTKFESVYAADPNDVLMQSCNNIIPANPAITGATSFCNGSNDTLKASPAGFIYQWSNSATGNSNSVSVAGTYDVTISNGTCSVTAAPFTITQRVAPATSSAITAPDSVCSGIANISVSVTNDTVATSYNWTLPAGWNISSGANTSAISAVSGDTGGIISVTAQNSCGVSSAMQKNIVVTSSGLAMPGPVFGDTTPCAGQQVQFITSGSTGASIYVWNYPSGWTLISDSTSDTLGLTVGTGSGSITVQAVNGCGQSIPAVLSVHPNTPPLSGNITGADSVCINNAGFLVYNLTGATGADSIYWSVPNSWNIISGQGTNNITVNSNQNGGNISASVFNVCGTANASPLILNIIDTAGATITQSHDTLSTDAGMAYQWFLNGVSIAGATAQTYVASQNGNYTVAITNSANCTDTSGAYNYIYLSLAPVQAQAGFNIFPNPSANGVFQLSISKELQGARLKIFDALGRQLFEKELTDENLALDLSVLPKGIYWANVQLNGRSVSRSLVIE